MTKRKPGRPQLHPADAKQRRLAIVCTDAESAAFYSGIRTALALLYLHGKDSIYDELVAV